MLAAQNPKYSAQSDFSSRKLDSTGFEPFGAVARCDLARRELNWRHEN
jgi:hypothetical protein